MGFFAFSETLPSNFLQAIDFRKLNSKDSYRIVINKKEKEVTLWFGELDDFLSTKINIKKWLKEEVIYPNITGYKEGEMPVFAAFQKPLYDTTLQDLLNCETSDDDSEVEDTTSLSKETVTQSQPFIYLVDLRDKIVKKISTYGDYCITHNTSIDENKREIEVIRCTGIDGTLFIIEYNNDLNTVQLSYRDESTRRRTGLELEPIDIIDFLHSEEW